MPDETEKIIDVIDKHFSGLYGLDDSMEIMRALYNKSFDPKSIDYNDAKEKLNSGKVFNIYVSNKGNYSGHYRLHSEKAINLLLALLTDEKSKKYLEDKIINFFNSFEWETWSYRYAETLEETWSYSAQKENSPVSGSTLLRRRRK